MNTKIAANSEEIDSKPEKAKSRFLQQVSDGAAIIFHNKTVMVGLVIILFWLFVAAFAPMLTSYSPTEQDWKNVNQGPSSLHPLGTDESGRDLWSRLIYGARVIFLVLPVTEKLWIPGGVVVWGVFVSLVCGIILGLTSGYHGGLIDEIVMRFVDALLAIPYILFYLIILARLGASATNVVIAISLWGIPGISRLVRGLTLDIRTRDYIRAAETRGERSWYIMFVTILPNARGPVIIDAMLRVGYAIFAMGTLGFLGLGLAPPSPDWGSMVAKGRNFILLGSPWAALWPSISIASIVVGLNLFADGLRAESMRYR